MKMDQLDKIISETLDDEDRQILDKIGWEQSLLAIVVDLFRGKLGLLPSFQANAYCRL